MIRLIDEHRDQFGVEAICRVMGAAVRGVITSHGYRAATTRAPSARRLHDDLLKPEIARLRAENYGVYGVTKMHALLKRRAERPKDLVNRDFTAPAPRRLWVADVTYVATWSGFAYVAFVTDVYSRRIVGWNVAFTLKADILPLRALDMAAWDADRDGRDLAGLVHYADHGSNDLAVVYTDRIQPTRQPPDRETDRNETQGEPTRSTSSPPQQA